MNAQQRRKAYRKIDRMVGKEVFLLTPTGRKELVTVVGRTTRVWYLSSTSDQSTFDGGRASVHRAIVKLQSGATQSPRISKLLPA